MNTTCTCCRWKKVIVVILLILGALLAFIGWDRFLRDHGVAQFDNPDDRFKYGSMGAENDAGIPYWIFYVLPRMFPEKIPKPGGLAGFGANWEQGKELPIGFTKRRIGFDRVANNCAACHVASYRKAHDEKPSEAIPRFVVTCRNGGGYLWPASRSWIWIDRVAPDATSVSEDGATGR